MFPGNPRHYLNFSCYTRRGESVSFSGCFHFVYCAKPHCARCLKKFINCKWGLGGNRISYLNSANCGVNTCSVAMTVIGMYAVWFGGRIVACRRPCFRNFPNNFSRLEVCIERLQFREHRGVYFTWRCSTLALARITWFNRGYTNNYTAWTPGDSSGSGRFHNASPMSWLGAAKRASVCFAICLCVCARKCFLITACAARRTLKIPFSIIARCRTAYLNSPCFC